MSGVGGSATAAAAGASDHPYFITAFHTRCASDPTEESAIDRAGLWCDSLLFSREDAGCELTTPPHDDDEGGGGCSATSGPVDNLVLRYLVRESCVSVHNTFRIVSLPHVTRNRRRDVTSSHRKKSGRDEGGDDLSLAPGTTAALLAFGLDFVEDRHTKYLERYNVIGVLLERVESDDVGSAAADHGAVTSSPPSASPRGDCHPEKGGITKGSGGGHTRPAGVTTTSLLASLTDVAGLIESTLRAASAQLTARRSKHDVVGGDGEADWLGREAASFKGVLTAVRDAVSVALRTWRHPPAHFATVHERYFDTTSPQSSRQSSRARATSSSPERGGGRDHQPHRHHQHLHLLPSSPLRDSFNEWVGWAKTAYSDGKNNGSAVLRSEHLLRCLERRSSVLLFRAGPSAPDRYPLPCDGVAFHIWLTLLLPSEAARNTLAMSLLSLRVAGVLSRYSKLPDAAHPNRQSARMRTFLNILFVGLREWSVMKSHRGGGIVIFLSRGHTDSRRPSGLEAVPDALNPDDIAFDVAQDVFRNYDVLRRGDAPLPRLTQELDAGLPLQLKSTAACIADIFDIADDGDEAQEHHAKLLLRCLAHYWHEYCSLAACELVLSAQTWCEMACVCGDATGGEVGQPASLQGMPRLLGARFPFVMAPRQRPSPICSTPSNANDAVGDALRGKKLPPQKWIDLANDRILPCWVPPRLYYFDEDHGSEGLAGADDSADEQARPPPPPGTVPVNYQSAVNPLFFAARLLDDGVPF